MADARGELITNEARHGPEDQQRRAFGRGWLCLVRLLALRLPLPHQFQRPDRRVDRRRRLLPAGQLHRVGTAQQRERPRAGRAGRPPAGRRGWRPGFAAACRSSAGTCRSWRRRWTRLFAEVRASIENAQALGMYDPVTSLPNRLHFRSEADKLLADSAPGSQLRDAVRRPRPLQDGQRQPRPCPRRPAADHGREPAARRRHRRTHRDDRPQRRCWRAWPATSSPSSSPRFASVADVERVARRIARRHCRAVRALRAQRRHRRVHRRRASAPITATASNL